MPILVCIVLLPFMQIGLSYYISIQVVIAGILIVSGNALPLVSHNTIIRLLAAYGIFVMPMFYQSGYNNSDIARSLREAIAFFLISGAVNMVGVYGEKQIQKLLAALLVFSIGMLVLVCAQIFFLSAGVYFGLPVDWFVINTSTLPDELDLLYSSLRPSGTYGEPSYAAIACFVIMFGLGPLYKMSHKVRLIILILFITVLLTRAMSGIISCSLLFIYYRLQRDRAINAIALTGALMVLPLVISVAEFAVISRFEEIFRGEDFSFNARILTPLMSMPHMLKDYPFGIPGKQLSEMAYVPGILVIPGHLTHNGILNLVNNYGFFGFFLIFALFAQYKNILFSYFIIILMMQNGGFLAFDKFSLAALGVILYRSFEASSIRSMERHGHSSLRSDTVQAPS